MSEPNPLEYIQDQIRGDELVCSFELSAVTPILIGGYDTRTSHEELGAEGLRPLSVKGVWRWWVRAFISAAFCRRFQSFLDLESADRIAARILGTVRDRSRSSKYQVIVRDENARWVSQENYDRVARLRLLGLEKSRQRDKVLGPRSRFKVELYKSAETQGNEDALAAASLLIALTLGGVGKATSRGFGKLALRRWYGKTPDLGRVVEHIKSLSQPAILRGGEIQVEEVVRRVKGALEMCVRLAEPLVENTGDAAPHANYSTGESTLGPLIETPLSEYYEVIVPRRVYKNDVAALTSIGYATLKLYWKAYHILRNTRISPEQALRKAREIHGLSYHTWILGLPRQQETTGYFSLIDGEEVDNVRRRSPIIFTPVSVEAAPGRTSYYVIVLGFKTYDWFRIVLEHRSPVTGEKAVVRTSSDVDSAFTQALDFIRGVMETF